MGKLGAYFYRVREGATLPQAFICPLALSAGAHPQSLRPLSRPSRAQLHISLGDGNAPQGGVEVVFIPLPDAAPTPDPALDPEPALVPDLALDPENAVLDP